MARMFSPSNESSVDAKDDSDLTVRYKGLLIQSLQKLHFQVHPTLTASSDALDYVESLILRLLGTLCVSRTHTTQDVEERVTKAFPKPLDHVAIQDARTAIERWQMAGTLRRPRLPPNPGHGLTLPVEKLHTQIRELIGYKVEMAVSLFVCAVLEYIARDILKLAGNYVKNIRHVEITLQDCRVAMCADPFLYELFCFTSEDWVEEIPSNVSLEKNYANQVSDLIVDESEHIKNLQLIIKVFRHALQKQLSEPLEEEEAADIFGNIEDVLEFSTALLSSFEDVVEMTDENQTPAVGSCFYDMAESYEFEVYEEYAHTVASPKCSQTLQAVLERPAVQEALQRSSQGFWLAAKYVLPRLLWTPVFHCLHHFELIRSMQALAPTDEDRESLEQTDGLIGNLKTTLTTLAAQSPLRKIQEGLFLRRRTSLRITAAQKLAELAHCIDGWSELQQREIAQSCQEFILEGSLLKGSPGNKRPTERYAFLFDGLLCLCKPTSALSRGRSQSDKEIYRLKEKFFIRKIEVFDKPDTDDLKYAFEIICRHDGNSAAAQSTVLIAKNAEEKVNWLASLVAVNMRSYLERSLDSILSAEEKQNPLRLPENYAFSEPDLPTNIIFEEKSTNGVPSIKAATLPKLVERLTFHMYADFQFVRTFLTTFRTFCEPKQLLSLLIERFNIPEFEEIDYMANGPDLQQTAKRFRKEYQQPVKSRVLNVMRQWVDHHYYDFERSPELLADLKAFLESMRQDSRTGKKMRKWIDSIAKAIQRKCDHQAPAKEHTFSQSPPPIEWFLTRDPEKFDWLSLHPVEIARQLTLLEFDHYRAVQPSELVNMPWMKKEKKIASPNLLKIIHHSSKLSFYLEKLIVECQNFEERVAVYSRSVEIMGVLHELNNFTGAFAISTALQSAPLHRLRHTKEAIRTNLQKVRDDVFDLQTAHWRKYQERLRSINPPCVPFLGMYLTNILHIEEGNPETISIDGGPELINFSKRRKVAEITGEIQQYQNQPYNLTVEKDIRAFLEQLGPEVDLSENAEKELTDYLYKCSLEIEPRKQPPMKGLRRWPDITLKSPGTKVARNSSRSASSSNPTSFLPGLNHHHNEQQQQQQSHSQPSSYSSSNQHQHHHHNNNHNHHHHHHHHHHNHQHHQVSSSATSPNPPHSPEDGNSLHHAQPSTPTSPPSSANEHHMMVSFVNSSSDVACGHSNSLTPQQSVPPVPMVAHRRQNSQPASISGVFFPPSPSSPHQHPARFAFPESATAPPLPPRTRRDDSTSPALPPRGAGQSESPPPLPPRKPLAPQQHQQQQQPQQQLSPVSLIPQQQQQQPPPVAMVPTTSNAAASPMPLLPPRTHKKPRPPPLVLHDGPS